MDPIQTQNPNQVGQNPYDLIGNNSPFPQGQNGGIGSSEIMQSSQGTIPTPQQTQIPPFVAPSTQTGGISNQSQIQGNVGSNQSEGILEKIVKMIVRFIAKASGNPDPITGKKIDGNTQAPSGGTSGGIFGQIGGVFTGIAETAQGMVGSAISGVQQMTQTNPSQTQQTKQEFQNSVSSMPFGFNTQVPMQGGQTPMQGGQIPMQGGQIPMQGGQIPMQGGQIPVQGGQVPMQGGQVPVQGISETSIPSSSNQ